LQVLQFLLLQELQADEEEDGGWEKASLPLENFAPKVDNCLSTRQPWQWGQTIASFWVERISFSKSWRQSKHRYS